MDRFEIAAAIMQLSPLDQDLILGWMLGRKQLEIESRPKRDRCPDLRRRAFGIDDL